MPRKADALLTDTTVKISGRQRSATKCGRSAGRVSACGSSWTGAKSSSSALGHGELPDFPRTWRNSSEPHCPLNPGKTRDVLEGSSESLSKSRAKDESYMLCAVTR